MRISKRREAAQAAMDERIKRVGIRYWRADIEPMYFTAPADMEEGALDEERLSEYFRNLLEHGFWDVTGIELADMFVVELSEEQPDE